MSPLRSCVSSRWRGTSDWIRWHRASFYVVLSAISSSCRELLGSAGTRGRPSSGVSCSSERQQTTPGDTDWDECCLGRFNSASCFLDVLFSSSLHDSMAGLASRLCTCHQKVQYVPSNSSPDCPLPSHLPPDCPLQSHSSRPQGPPASGYVPTLNNIYPIY